MGSLSDAIDEMEDELHDLTNEVKRLDIELGTANAKLDECEKELEDLRGYVKWIDMNYLDARRTYNALQKLKE